jgi:hypothetical protein
MTTEQILIAGVTGCGSAIVAMAGMISWILKSTKIDNKELLGNFITLSNKFAEVTDRFDTTTKDIALSQEKSLNRITDKLQVISVNVFENQKILCKVTDQQTVFNQRQDEVNIRQDAINRSNIINKKP